MIDDLILMANPALLAQEKPKFVKQSRTGVFNDALKDILRRQYDSTYLSDKAIDNIRGKIDQEIKSINSDRIVNEALEACIEEVIRLNKFDFCLPFD